MKVSTLKAKIRRLWITVPGEDGAEDEKVWVDYRPGALTLEVADDLKEAVASGFDSDSAFVMVRSVLAGWDLEDDDGSPLGITDEDIKKVPLQFLGLVMQAMEDDSRPNSQRGATSNGSLPQTEPQDESRSGTSSFAQPTD